MLNRYTWKASLIMLLSSSNIVAYWFDPTLTKLAALIVPILFFIGIGRLFPFSNRLLLVIFTPFILVSFVDLVYLMQYNVQITAGLISAIFESDTREIKEFIQEAPKSVVYALIIYCGAYVALTFFSSNCKIAVNKRNIVVTILLIVLPMIDMIGKGASARSFPLGAAREAYVYTRDTIVANKLLEQRKGFFFNASTNLPPNEKLNIVLVIGETSRRDYYSLYGFSRKTNPRMEKVAPLAVFRDVVSPANATIPSLKSMLYMATVEDSTTFYTTKSIVSLAKEAGYDTSWLSSQARFGEFDATSGATGIEAKNKVFINQTRAISLVYDEALLPHLKASLAHKASKKFIVMHLYGSHLAYDRRYPEDFDYFKGVPPGYSGSSAEIQNKINHYTNSIRYTDYVLSEIVRQLELKNVPSCVVYTPDHGEYLADNPDEVFTGHGYPVPHKVEVEVPMFVWCNNKYRERNKEKWVQITKNIRLKINNEDLFYSLADLMRIDFNLMKPERSFLGGNYQEKLPRKVKSTNFNYINLK